MVKVFHYHRNSHYSPRPHLPQTAMDYKCIPVLDVFIPSLYFKFSVYLMEVSHNSSKLQFFCLCVCFLNIFLISFYLSYYINHPLGSVETPFPVILSKILLVCIKRGGPFKNVLIPLHSLAENATQDRADERIHERGT